MLLPGNVHIVTLTTGGKNIFDSSDRNALRFQLDCILIVAKQIEASDMCAGAFCVRVVPFDACKVKWLPHPERLLSALVRHSIGCDLQPGASLTGVN